MLHRQKVLLLILQQVGGKADNLQLMKWSFLLSQETLSQGGKTFYHFIPYRYGPYSFTLNQETDSLIRSGFLEKDSNNSWNLTDIGKKADTRLPLYHAMIEDWELGVLWLNEVDRLGDEEQAALSVRQKFLNELCHESKDTRFFMGTRFPYNRWIVLGVFYPPKPKNLYPEIIQGTLF